MRIGAGYDSHRFEENRRLILGGAEIPYHRGLSGHSDADVLVHAVCDAVLGAIGEGDLGQHFPDTDPLYKDISSLKLLTLVSKLAEKKGCRINNVDSTVILEEPKLARYIPQMKLNLAAALNIPVDRINIKATTNEGMGFVGRGEGAAALAHVTVWEPADQGY